MSVNITPAMRVEQYPDEFEVRKNRLWCKWCNRPMNHCRKDNMNEHLWSRSHQEARVAQGSKMSYDPESEQALERRKRRSEKAAMSKKRNDSRGRRMKVQQLDQSSEVSSEDSDAENGADLRQLFEDSDSNSSTSFEGFDNTPSNRSGKSNSTSASMDEDSRRSARSRKRPARLDDSLDKRDMAKIGKIADQAAFVSGTRRRKTTDEYSSPSSCDLSPPPRIRSMPIKKQISFSARHSDSSSPVTSPTSGSLKMKFSRAPSKKNSAAYSIKKGKKIKVVPSSAGKGLKLKFVWKKKQVTQSSEDTDSKDSDEEEIKGNMNSEPQGYEEMLRGITEGANTIEESVVDNGEVIEEEIVDMNDDVVLQEDWVPPNNDPVNEEQEVNEVTEDNTPAMTETDKKRRIVSKAQKIKRMAKSVTKGHFKSKKPKKENPTDERKKKTTGYMLWAKQMREKVSKQYPGLEFGDVSKKLGDLWKKIPDKEKQMWKFRNQKMEKQISMKTFRKSGSKMIETGPKKKPPPPAKNYMSMASPPVKNPEAAMRSELSRFPAPASEPIDCAAYFSLLGESFEKLSGKTKKAEVKAISDGAEGILLDSLVCALAPLINLTRQLPRLENAIDPKVMSKTLTNIAHIMPGL